MEKIIDGTSRFGKSHFGYNLEDWESNMDLDFSWTGILRSLLKVILKKIKIFL